MKTLNHTTNCARQLAALLPLAVLSACGDGADQAATGVAGTLEGPDAMVSAVTEEVFTVGSVTGDAWDSFGRVGVVGFDAEARLHILDTQADQIHVVGPDGALIRTVGGPGEGPGEFRSPQDLIVARDGASTVLGMSQIDLLNPEGEFVRRVTMNPSTGLVSAGLALPGGRLVTPRLMRFNDDEEEPLEGRPIYIFSLDSAEAEVLYIAWDLRGEDAESEFDVSDNAMRMRMAAGRAFEPPLALDLLTDGRLALVDTIGYRIKLIAADGQVTGMVERPIAPLPVDEAIMEAERERYRETTASFQERTSNSRNNAPMQFEFEREGAEHLTFADEVPVIARIKVDWEDRIWVKRRDATGGEEGLTDIVTPAGDYIGTLPPEGIAIPDAFGPGGLMAYIETDEFDVPRVRVVRLVALEPQG